MNYICSVLLPSFILIFLPCKIFSGVTQEYLFAQTFIHPGKWDGVLRKKGSVIPIKGDNQFFHFVFQNQKPVVVKFFKSSNITRQSGDAAMQKFYEEVAGSLENKIDFVTVDVDRPENKRIVGIVQSVSFPKVLQFPSVFLFKQNTLILPSVQLPRLIPKDKKSQIKDSFINYIEKQFSRRETKPLSKNDASTLKNKTAESKSVSTMEKIIDLSEKVSNWLSGLKGVSTKEMKAYHLCARGASGRLSLPGENSTE